MTLNPDLSMYTYVYIHYLCAPVQLGFTALIECARSGRLDLVTVLLERKANVDKKNLVSVHTLELFLVA